MAKNNKTNAAEAKTAKANAAEAKETSKVLKFTKAQFVKSQKFAKRKDLVNVLLKEDKTYSIKEVEDLINNFLYGKK